MKLVLTEEEQFLKDTAKNFAVERSPISHFRSLRDNIDDSITSRLPSLVLLYSFSLIDSRFLTDHLSIEVRQHSISFSFQSHNEIERKKDEPRCGGCGLQVGCLVPGTQVKVPHVIWTWTWVGLHKTNQEEP